MVLGRRGAGLQRPVTVALGRGGAGWHWQEFVLEVLGGVEIGWVVVPGLKAVLASPTAAIGNLDQGPEGGSWAGLAV